jgi:predicted  nucleic acid-binding Zn-ribbon protein
MTDIQKQITIIAALQDVEFDVRVADQHIVALNNEANSLGQAATEHHAQVAAEKETLSALRKDYRDLETESKDNAVQIEKSNEKLRAVKTNKEYQSILKEIEEIRKKNSGIEDRMIELLDQIEKQEASIQQKKAQLERFVQECDQKKMALDDQIQTQKKNVEQLNAKIEQLRASADPDAIAVMDDVKTKIRSGGVIAPVEQAVCKGCHMNIPPQLNNELLRFDEFRFCPHCNRIIYWKEKEQDAE